MSTPSVPSPVPAGTEREAVIGALVSALERTRENFVAAVRGTPVRDMAETLAEADAALAAVVSSSPATPPGNGAIEASYEAQRKRELSNAWDDGYAAAKRERDAADELSRQSQEFAATPERGEAGVNDVLEAQMHAAEAKP